MYLIYTVVKKLHFLYTSCAYNCIHVHIHVHILSHLLSRFDLIYIHLCNLSITVMFMDFLILTFDV